MRQRISSISVLFGTLLALALVVLPMLPGTAAASSQNGLQRENSYQSPQFAYTVTWGDDWDARPRDVISNRGGYDTLTLRGPGTLLVQGQGTDVTAAEAVAKRIQIEGGDRDVVAQNLEGDVPAARMAVGRKVILIEGYTLETNDAVVLIVLSAREKDFDAALNSVHEQIRFNGGPMLTGVDVVEGDGAEAPSTTTSTAEPSPTATGEATATEAVAGTPVDLAASDAIDDGTYTSPLYDYTFTFDPDQWTVDTVDSTADSDVVKLENDTGVLTIWSWNNYGADPVACLDGEAAYYENEDATVTNWAPAEDASGEPIRYEADDYAYGVYTLTYTAPDGGAPVDLVDYIECRTIPGEDAEVIIFGSATPEQYNDHLDTVLDVAETITFAQEAPPQATEPATAPAQSDLPDTALSGSLYTSPSFGFTIDIPVQWQVVDETLAVNDEQLTVNNGTSEVLIWATDGYTGDLAGCVDFAAENAPYDLELATTADGKPFRGSDRNGAYGNFLYDNGAQAYSISCRYIAEGESVLIVAQDVPADELASQRKFRIDLQQSIELP